MLEISIIPDDESLANLVSSMEMMGSKYMPKTYRAIKMAAAAVEYTWKSYALGAPIPGSSMRIKSPNGEYARSIKTKRLTPFSATIYSDSPYAKSLEDGTEQIDLKKILPFSKRSRKNKQGKGYNIIPMRHGVPGTVGRLILPETLYSRIRTELKNGSIDVSRVIKGKTLSENYKGELIPRARYNWGSRISCGIKNLDGLVIMDVSTPQSKRSEYLTFRVISENSPAFKWIIPAKPAMKITRFVVQNTKSIVRDIIKQGLTEDLGLKV